MKKTYIQPETDLLLLQSMGLIAHSVEGINVGGSDSEILDGGEDEEGKDADTKENVFEENPWEETTSGNYWE